MTYFESASILLLIANGILMPIVLYYVASGKQARAAGFAALEGRLNHLDQCLDALKLQVAASGITRPEVETKILDLRREMQDELTKQIMARHDQATRVQVLVDSVEERLTRRIERVERPDPTILRPGGAMVGA